jgi:glyoxylase-like metal-dependent hydrolase (beta-lactamase superfamily II)
MLFRRFYDDPLAQSSYLIGCQATGDAFVIDPNRDADQYIAAAEAERMRIVGVAETHIHADFLSAPASWPTAPAPACTCPTPVPRSGATAFARIRAWYP